MPVSTIRLAPTLASTRYVTGRDPKMRMSTNLRALCRQFELACGECDHTDKLERKLAGEGQAFLDVLRGRIRAASEASPRPTICIVMQLRFTAARNRFIFLTQMP